jgi:hypothetical protein
MIKQLLIFVQGISQLIMEFSIFNLIFIIIIAKPFIFCYVSYNIRMIEDLSFLTYVFLHIAVRFMFLWSLFFFFSIVYLIYYLILTDNLFLIVYLYLYTIDVYIYNPLGISSNPLNLPWGRFTK